MGNLCIRGDEQTDTSGYRRRTEASSATLENDFHPQIKITLLGPSGVGKTSLATRFTKHTFVEGHEATRRGATFKRGVTVEDSKVKLVIWENPSSHMEERNISSYIQDSAAAIVVYDATSDLSLGAAKRWMKALLNADTEGLIIALVANKCEDLERCRQNVAEGKNVAQVLQVLFCDVSTKDDRGVDELFNDIIKKELLRRRSPLA